MCEWTKVRWIFELLLRDKWICVWHVAKKRRWIFVRTGAMSDHKQLPLLIEFVMRCACKKINHRRVWKRELIIKSLRVIDIVSVYFYEDNYVPQFETDRPASQTDDCCIICFLAKCTHTHSRSPILSVPILLALRLSISHWKIMSYLFLQTS